MLSRAHLIIWPLPRNQLVHKVVIMYVFPSLQFRSTWSLKWAWLGGANQSPQSTGPQGPLWTSSGEQCGRGWAVTQQSALNIRWCYRAGESYRGLWYAMPTDTPPLVDQHENESVLTYKQPIYQLQCKPMLNFLRYPKQTHTHCIVVLLFYQVPLLLLTQELLVSWRKLLPS